MRTMRFAAAIAAYVLFLLTFLYLVGFVGNFLVPRTIDAGAYRSPPLLAVAIDIMLVALFAVQHSVMARPWFKDISARVFPQAFGRTVYVAAASLVLWILFAFWQPVPAVVSSVNGRVPASILWALFAIGWTVVFISTWLMNHFELFGLQQTWHDMRGRDVPPQKFREPMFYRYTRHPLYLGFLLAFWAIPVMSVGHLIFATAMTVYVLIAIRYEERDLTAFLGEQYSDYRRRVGMLLPGIGKVRRN